MPLERRNVVSSLNNKGFKEDRRGDHIFYVYRGLSGEISRIRTRVSHSKKVKTLDEGLVGQMAKQCKLSRKDFRKFVDCSMDQTEYEEKVREYL